MQPPCTGHGLLLPQGPTALQQGLQHPHRAHLPPACPPAPHLFPIPPTPPHGPSIPAFTSSSSGHQSLVAQPVQWGAAGLVFGCLALTLPCCIGVAQLSRALRGAMHSLATQDHCSCHLELPDSVQRPAELGRAGALSKLSKEFKTLQEACTRSCECTQ